MIAVAIRRDTSELGASWNSWAGWVVWLTIELASWLQVVLLLLSAVPLLVLLWPYAYIVLCVVFVQDRLVFFGAKEYNLFHLQPIFQRSPDHLDAWAKFLRLLTLCGIFSVFSALEVVLDLTAEAAVGVYSGGHYLNELKYSFSWSTRQGVKETLSDDYSWVLSII